MEQEYGKEGQGAQEQERLQNKLFGIKRTLADIAMIQAAALSHYILMGLFDDDDDMDPTLRRLQNLTIYQADRTYKELVMYVPAFVSAKGFDSGVGLMSEFISDPIASSRNLGQVGEALSSTFNFGYQKIAMATPTGGLDGEWGISKREHRQMLENSNLYYQNKPKKGMLKMRKEWFDAIPALYTIQKWEGFLRRHDFYID